DMGFIHDIKRILPLLPKQRQTLFFSATMPNEIASLADSILHKPVRVEVSPASSTVDTIEQYLYMVEKEEKKLLLVELLKDPSKESVLVFSRTKHGADKIAKILSQAGVQSEAIHGNKSQNARQRALSNFKERKTRVLIATDIAARGIDVDNLSHVINYDLPEVPETYVHRIGRTGRAGREGIALSFCSSDEIPLLKDIQKLIGKQLNKVENHGFETEAGLKAVHKASEQVKTKAKENKEYRGSKASGDFWRRQKRNEGKEGAVSFSRNSSKN
ncbi:MAG: helicase-related protein, partial [Bacteroidales bacterium]